MYIADPPSRLRTVLVCIKELGTLVVAVIALIIALYTWQDTRSIEALDIKPQMIVLANFDMEKGGELNVLNRGPNDAHQVEVDFFIHHYDEKRGRFTVSTMSSDYHQEFMLLEARKRGMAKIPSDLTYQIKSMYELKLKTGSYALFAGDPAIELRLSYRCLPDYRRYIESAIYFVNDDGRIVGEHDNSINKEPYISMRNKFVDRVKLDLGFEKLTRSLFTRGDELHLIYPEK